jgi:hypothetical protein
MTAATLVRVVDGPGLPLELRWLDANGIDRGRVVAADEAVAWACEMAWAGVSGRTLQFMWSSPLGVRWALLAPAHALALAEALLRGVRVRLPAAAAGVGEGR